MTRARWTALYYFGLALFLVYFAAREFFGELFARCYGEAYAEGVENERHQARRASPPPKKSRRR